MNTTSARPPGRRTGAGPTGSTVLPDLPNLALLAALRAWHEGLTARATVDRYLPHVRGDGQSSRGVIARLRRRIGLSLGEGKNVLHRLQKIVVAAQSPSSSTNSDARLSRYPRVFNAPSLQACSGDTFSTVYVCLPSTFAAVTRCGVRADVKEWRFTRRRIRPSCNASESERVATNTLKIQALSVSLVGELA
jgi:hypothetical protein